MTLIAPRHRALFVFLFCVFILFGTSMTIIGATLPKILEDFGWGYLVAGTVIGASAVTYFLSTFAAGYLVKHWGAKPTLVFGLCLAIVGLAFFARTPAPLANVLLSALIGIGQGCLEIVINWATLRIDAENTGRPMNLMHGAFALGAILGPLAVGVLARAGFDWVEVYRAMAAVVFVLLVVLIIFVTLPADAPASEESTAPAARLVTHPAYWLSFFALFVYVGVELGLSNWVAEYFVAVFRFSAADGALMLSLFWAGLLAGRFGAPLLPVRGNQDRLLVGLSALATISAVALSLLGLGDADSAGRPFAVPLVFAAGLGCSVYYPAVISLLGRIFPHAQSRAIGFAATGGGIGAFVFPFLMSALSEHWGIRAGFAIYGGFAALMTLLALRLTRAGRTHQD